MREFFNGWRRKAGCVALACPLLLAIGCGRKSSPPGVSSTPAAVESSPTEQITNGPAQTSSEFSTSVQLPDIAYWVKAGGRHFEDHGVRDATAPNMMLSQWVYDLEWLNLYRCRNISEKSVAGLGKMQRLHMVGVGGTGIAPLFRPTAAVHDLQRLLPKCIVDHGE